MFPDQNNAPVKVKIHTNHTEFYQSCRYCLLPAPESFASAIWNLTGGSSMCRHHKTPVWSFDGYTGYTGNLTESNYCTADGSPNLRVTQRHRVYQPRTSQQRAIYFGFCKVCSACFNPVTFSLSQRKSSPLNRE